MNTVRIIQAAQDIERHQKALSWLREYGSELTGRNRDEGSVTVTLAFASGCPGAKEAQEVLSAYARLSLPDLVQTAIKSCENTIEMCANAIREEGAAQ